MKVIDPNYEPPAQEFDTFPDGNYKVKGLEWFTKSNDRPSLKAQKDGRMVGRCRWFLEDGKQGPPQSFDLSEMALLGAVYGMKDTPPSLSNAGAVATYMEKLQKAASTKVVDATVYKGWASIKQMTVPQGYYRFYLSRVSDLRDGEFGKYFFAEFTIVSGEGGSPTPYKGATFSEIVNYGVKVVDGQPTWETTEKNQPTAAAARLSTLIRLTAPEYAAGDISPADPNNILPEWMDEAISAKKILKGSRAETTSKDGKKRVGLVMQTLEPAYEDGTSDNNWPKKGEPEIPFPSSSQNGNSTDSPKDILINLMSDKMGGPSFVADRLTDLGKKFAKQYLVPLKDKGLIVNTSFILLTDEEVLEIIKLVVKGSEELGIKEDFIYEGDLERVQKLLNKEYTIIKDGDPTDVPEGFPQGVVEEENPFS